MPKIRFQAKLTAIGRSRRDVSRLPGHDRRISPSTATRRSSFEPGGQGAPVWSPNGGAVAYTARPIPFGPEQIFVRYLNAATGLQLTRAAQGAYCAGVESRWDTRSGDDVAGAVRHLHASHSRWRTGVADALAGHLAGRERNRCGPYRLSLQITGWSLRCRPTRAASRACRSLAMSDGSTVRYSPEPFATKDVENPRRCGFRRTKNICS